MSVNKAIILGRLGKDPEIRSFQSGDKVANFSVATSESWKDKATGERKEATEWHNVSVFGGLVQVVEAYLTKGQEVYLEGQIKTRKWQDSNGNDRYTTEVVLRGPGAVLRMVGGKGDASSTPRPAPEPSQSTQDLDDDIPF